MKTELRTTYYYYDGPLLFTANVGHSAYLGVAVGDTDNDTDYCMYPLTPRELINLERGATTFRAIQKRRHYSAWITNGANLGDKKKWVFDQQRLDEDWWLPCRVTVSNLYDHSVLKRHVQRN